MIVYRGLEYWIEADIKNHECKVYKIHWFDECNFTLLYNNTISESKALKFYKTEADSLNYSFDAVNSNSINYDVKSGYSITKQKLTSFSDSLAWQYLIYADTNLYFDTTEIKELYGRPIENYSYNTPSFINLEMDSSESQFVNYILFLFKSGDIKPAFNYASPVLKSHSPQQVLDDYNIYLSSLFGKLTSYQAESIKEGYRINKNSSTHSYIINGAFEKMGKAAICISVMPGAANTLLSLSVVADSANKIPYLTQLTKNFWELLKHKKYKEIYEGSSAMLKANITFDDAKKTLNTMDSLGHFNDYTIYFQNFSVIKNKGVVVISFKCPLPGKTLFMNLFYTFEEGAYKLAGINAPKG